MSNIPTVPPKNTTATSQNTYLNPQISDVKITPQYIDTVLFLNIYIILDSVREF